MSPVDYANRRVVEALDSAVKDMGPEDYREVLEYLQGEIEARLECVKEEAEDRD
jgi:hypothetical protein